MRNKFIFSLKVSLSEKCPNHSIKDRDYNPIMLADYLKTHSEKLIFPH